MPAPPVLAEKHMSGEPLIETVGLRKRGPDMAVYVKGNCLRQSRWVNALTYTGIEPPFRSTQPFSKL